MRPGSPPACGARCRLTRSRMRCRRPLSPCGAGRGVTRARVLRGSGSGGLDGDGLLVRPRLRDRRDDLPAADLHECHLGAPDPEPILTGFLAIVTHAALGYAAGCFLRRLAWTLPVAFVAIIPLVGEGSGDRRWAWVAQPAGDSLSCGCWQRRYSSWDSASSACAARRNRGRFIARWRNARSGGSFWSCPVRVARRAGPG